MRQDKMKELFEKAFPDLNLADAVHKYEIVLAYQAFCEGLSTGFQEGVKQQAIHTAKTLNSLLNP